MAMCNSIMKQPETQLGINALAVYIRCTSVKAYIDDHYVTQIDKTTYKTSLMPIHVFFMKDYKSNPYVLSDGVPLK